MIEEVGLLDLVERDLAIVCREDSPAADHPARRTQLGVVLHGEEVATRAIRPEHRRCDFGRRHPAVRFPNRRGERGVGLVDAVAHGTQQVGPPQAVDAPSNPMKELRCRFDVRGESPNLGDVHRPVADLQLRVGRVGKPLPGAGDVAPAAGELSGGSEVLGDDRNRSSRPAEGAVQPRVGAIERLGRGGERGFGGSGVAAER